MKISVKERYNAVVLELKGNVLGGLDSSLFKNEINKQIEAGRKNFVIDLSRVSMMNSSGLGILVSGLTSIKNSDGNMKISNPTEKIKSLFMITRLVTIFDTYNSLDEAVESFAE